MKTHGISHFISGTSLRDNVTERQSALWGHLREKSWASVVTTNLVLTCASSVKWEE